MPKLSAWSIAKANVFISYILVHLAHGINGILWASLSFNTWDLKYLNFRYQSDFAAAL